MTFELGAARWRPPPCCLRRCCPRRRSSTAAAAPPPQAQQNPFCARLEAQLQAFDRGGNDAGRADSSASSRKPPPTSRPSSTARRRRRSARAARRTASSSCSAAIRRSAARSTTRSSRCGTISTASSPTWSGCAAMPAPEREGQRRAILVALAQNNCGPQYQQQVAATPPPRSGGLFESLFGPKSVFARPAAAATRRRRRRRAAPSAPSACAPATASIIPISCGHSPARFARGRKDLPAVLPGRRGAALLPPQSRRGHQPGGLGQRPAALHGAAERVPLSHRVRSELQLPAPGRDLGRRR